MKGERRKCALPRLRFLNHGERPGRGSMASTGGGRRKNRTVDKTLVHAMKGGRATGKGGKGGGSHITTTKGRERNGRGRREERNKCGKRELVKYPKEKKEKGTPHPSYSCAIGWSRR